jgi:hypothetical protein
MTESRCNQTTTPRVQLENARQGVPASSPAAPATPAPGPSSREQTPPPQLLLPSLALTSLSSPDIDWVALAAGMGVPAGRAETAGQLAELVREGLRRDGPFLVMAVI